MFYSIGPWQWKTEDGQSFWAAPAGTVGLIDLRPLAACAATEKHALNFGLFVSEKKLDSSYDSLGSYLEEPLTVAQRDAWAQTVGIKSLAGRKLLDVLWETLTFQSDPEQGRRVQSLRPGQNGIMRLTLCGKTLKHHHFVGASDVLWPRIKDAIQSDFRKNFEQDAATSLSDREAHLRLLTDWQTKYKIADWKEFVPADLLKDVPGPKPKHTTLGDTFVDTNGTALSAHTATGPNGGFGWAHVLDVAEIQGNEVAGASAWDACRARAESNLSSADHYAQIKLVSADAWVIARYATSADTGYMAGDNDNNDKLRKVVAGTETGLWDSGWHSGHAYPLTFKCEIDGTTLKCFRGGVQQHSMTDSSISSNVRAGIQTDTCGETPPSTGRIDDFEAADLAAGGHVPHNLILQGAS